MVNAVLSPILFIPEPHIRRRRLRVLERRFSGPPRFAYALAASGPHPISRQISDAPRALPESWRAYRQNRGGIPCERLALIKSERSSHRYVRRGIRSAGTAPTGRVGENPGFLAKCLGSLAPRAGFEPATIRLTVECSIAELPRN